LGWRGGLLSALLAIPLNMFLFTLVGRDDMMAIREQWLGVILSFPVGVIMGLLNGLVQQVQTQTRELAREREALKAEILERRHIEQELQQAKTDAEAANRAKSAFLAHMSHELRTPLTAIIGYSDLIALQAAQTGDQDLILDTEHIRSASQHLLSLINNILDISKIEAGKMDLYVEPFHLDDFIYEIVEITHPLMQKNKNTFHVQYVGDLGCMTADKTKLRQILLNLLGNAAKFTKNGTIILRIEQQNIEQLLPEQALLIAQDATDLQGSLFVFQISDTGIGIDPAHLSNLFQPFTQIEDVSAHIQSGTGLGLALSQRLCSLMGGTITVESILGGGSTFIVRLPNRTADTPARSDIIGASQTKQLLETSR
jgi:signal transduction histidine kinase